MHFAIYINQNFGRYGGFAIGVYKHWTKVFNIDYYYIIGISSAFSSAISNPFKKVTYNNSIAFKIKAIFRA